MSLRALVHRGRDVAVRLAAYRAFNPIEDPANRLLVIRPDHFGDLLMLGPALRYMHENAVDHEICLMVGPWNESVARHIAPFCNVLTFDFPGFLRRSERASPLDPYREIGAAAAQLRKLRPQAALLMRDDHWWGAWMTREAGVPLRIGYDQAMMRPFLSHLLTVPTMHYVEQNLYLARSSLVMLGYDPPEIEEPRIEFPLDWQPTPEGTDAARHLLSNQRVTKDYFVVHPGTGAPVKQWPESRWAEVVRRLARDSGLTAILTGTASEGPICEQIAVHAGNDVVNLAGDTSLAALAELMRGARFVMGVDSGPLHLATAVETPTVHLYGPSDHTRYGPWGDPAIHRIIRAGMTCPSCGDLSISRPAGCGCMLAITSDQVISSALGMLHDAR